MTQEYCCFWCLSHFLRPPGQNTQHTRWQNALLGSFHNRDMKICRVSFPIRSYWKFDWVILTCKIGPYWPFLLNPGPSYWLNKCIRVLWKIEVGVLLWVCLLLTYTLNNTHSLSISPCDFKNIVWRLKPIVSDMTSFFIFFINIQKD